MQFLDCFNARDAENNIWYHKWNSLIALFRINRLIFPLSIFSALDAESEYLVQDALEKVMAGRTVLTIAHRLSTIKTADQIAVVSGGQVAEIGTYRDLIAVDEGIFRKLVERQTITS